MDSLSTRPVPMPPPSTHNASLYTNGNAHASSSSSTKHPKGISPTSDDPLFPPKTVIYPHGSILNPSRSLAGQTELPLPRIRFPARLRELGYGGEDGVYDWKGMNDGWRVYRPLKLPREWKNGIWGRSAYGTLAAAQIYMVMDADNRTPIYITSPSCLSCPQQPVLTIDELSRPSTRPGPFLACDRAHPECYNCYSDRRMREKDIAIAMNQAEKVSKPTCRWNEDAEWEICEYQKVTKSRVKAGEKETVVKQAEDGSNIQPTKKRRAPQGIDEKDGAPDEDSKKRKRRKSQAESQSGTPQDTSQGFISMSTQFPPATTPEISNSHPLDPLSNGPKLLRTSDQQWRERVLANSRRPQLDNVSGPAPVWASKRRALSSALEYFQNPVPTLGGTVDVGTGGQSGIARMVLLEGDAGEGYVFWGSNKSLGTLVLPLGYPRPIRTDRTQPGTRENPKGPKSGSPPRTLPPSPNLQVTKNFLQAHPGLDVLAHPEWRQEPDFPPGPREWFNTATPDDGEAPEINALLLAHRARTPVALAVAEDYGVVPWNVPRAFITLGWFWITDAWPEPTSWLPAKYGKTARGVRWRFRFDWCNAGQATHPWWVAPTPDPPVHLYQNRCGTADDSLRWNILGPGVSATESIKYPMKKPDGSIVAANVSNPEMWHCCESCLWTSLQVYAYKHYCLNEACPKYFQEPEGGDPHNSRKIILRAPRNVRRITPTDLGLVMRPRPQDGKQKSEVDPKLAGRDFWKGWCCDRCGMANERWLWKGWECDGCQQRFRVKRRIWGAADLWPDMRPIPIGPRIEDGTAMFPWKETTHSSIIWEDGLKVMLHGLRDRTEIHHALSHVGRAFNKDSTLAFEALQAQGGNEVDFKRMAVDLPKTRPSDSFLSPFFTYLCGPTETPQISSIPAEKVVSWHEAPLVCFSTTRLINTLACRIIDGEKEFNSALFLTMPSVMPATLTPWVTVPPHSSFGFLTLGSDHCTFTFRTPNSSTSRKKEKKMSVQAWHGDLVIVRTYEAALEVGSKLTGFGFVVIARQIYPGKNTRGDSRVPLPLTEIEDAPPHEVLSPETTATTTTTKVTSMRQAEVPAEEQGWMLGNMPLFPVESKLEVEA